MKDSLSLTRRRMLAASAGFASLATLNIGEANAAPVRGGTIPKCLNAAALAMRPRGVRCR